MRTPSVVAGGADPGTFADPGRFSSGGSFSAGVNALGYNNGYGSWRSALVSLVLWLCLLSATSFAAIPVTSWDAASEFNDSNNPDAANPSGVWSYGWKEKLTGRFFLASTPWSDPPSRFGWSSASGYPVIHHMIRPVAALMNGPNRAVFPPRGLAMHPGPNGEYAVLRFTAPSDGSYRVSGQFYALDDNATGTTTDVWILPNENKTAAFSGRIDYFHGAPFASFSSRIFLLKKGGTLDFEVGYGANKSYDYDTTGLMAVIEKIK